MEATNRLRKNEDFRRVYNHGKSMANRLLILYAIKNNLDFNRVGFTVSKKVGKSVVRSRVKRLIKESFRLNREKVQTGYDMVFVARIGCNEASYGEIESALLHLIRKMKLNKK